MRTEPLVANMWNNTKWGKTKVPCLKLILPRYTSCLHVIGQGDVMWPNIILPFLEANHTAENIPRMNTHSHVYIHTCRVPYFPIKKRDYSINITAEVQHKYQSIDWTLRCLQIHLDERYGSDLFKCVTFWINKSLNGFWISFIILLNTTAEKIYQPINCITFVSPTMIMKVLLCVWH